MEIDYTKFKDFNKLIDDTVPIEKSFEDFFEYDYFSSKSEALNIISDGYNILPSIYHKTVLDPLKNVFTNSYDELSGYLKRYPGRSIYRDYFDAIYQRKIGYMLKYTNAFEESCADIYDGFLSMEERVGVKFPDYQYYAPLVKWGQRYWGPYTWPVPAPQYQYEVPGLAVSLVNLPPAWTRNIVYWTVVGHEVAGHDIIRADDGLLNELEDIIVEQIKNDVVFKKEEEVTYNGRKIPFTQFASKYWRQTMSEASADVLGVLNIGPARGLGLALDLISYREAIRGERVLSKSKRTTAVHPFDQLRILMSADVIRNLPGLDVEISTKYADSLQEIAERYGNGKSDFKLIEKTKSGDKDVVIIPYEPMREAVKIVANTVAFNSLNKLDGHSFNEINTWTNSDESLSQRIADDLYENKEPSIESKAEGDVFAAHILAGSALTLANSYVNLIDTTEIAVAALNKLYNKNRVFRGFPISHNSDMYMHSMIPDS
jgi:hypothetical protein